MNQTLDPGCYTVLQLMLARGLFIGDEVRVASLRTAWSESGQAPEAFGQAINHLQQNALVKLGHSKNGPVAQLSKHGFALGQQKRRAPPELERRQTPTTNSAPPHRRRRVEFIKPPQATHTPPPAPHASATPATNSQRSKVTHGNVFAGKSTGPSPLALQMCVLGLLRNRHVRANGQLDYSCVLNDWTTMQLPQDDLLLAIKRLSDNRDIETVNHPRERILLTQQGFERYERAPATLEEGMDRWQARKYLRATKRLGTLPAA